MRRIAFLVSIITFSFFAANAQLEDIPPDYLNTLDKRAEKIVGELLLIDSNKVERVKKIIIIQYYQLSKIHDVRDAKKKALKDMEGEEKDKAKEQIKIESEAALYNQHAAYISSLSPELTQDQINMVKDGMTYGVFDRTYNGYLTLLPDLTEEQKRYIYRNLVEAREFAMDAGSSNAKHAWFGKYKGRINNYLSAQGYDLKQAEQTLKEKNLN